jgi:hypothetical protein
VKQVAYWWLFFWCQLIGFGLAYYFNVFHTAWAADVSKLTFVIVAVHALATAWVGTQTFTKARGVVVNEQPGWFLSELVLTLGMIGTVIGFIVMVKSTVGNLTNSELTTQELRALLAGLTSGIGTALWTTLFGLVSSACLKTQMNNLESIGDDD